MPIIWGSTTTVNNLSTRPFAHVYSVKQTQVTCMLWREHQFGSNSPGYGNHNAAFMTAEWDTLGRFCPQQTGEEGCDLWYDWASGDDEIPAARGDSSFDAYFPNRIGTSASWICLDAGTSTTSAFNSAPLFSAQSSICSLVPLLFLDRKTTPYNGHDCFQS